VFPHLTSDVELVHRFGALHHFFDEGKMTAVLEYLGQAGTDLACNLAPAPLGDVDLCQAKASIGDRVALHVTVEVVTDVLQGTPDEVREAVRLAVEAGAPGGGFVLGTSDSIRPETPPANVEAYFDAARRFAREAYA
jgi:uroporphyrinogen decarboxylase